MLVLYYWPGSSSIVPQIVLEEIGASYEAQLVNLARGEHKSERYLQINPHGKVPTLAIDGATLTENVAILTFLARRSSSMRLLPEHALEEARCLSLMSWFASTLHPTFAHIIRPERFASDSAAQANIKETARTSFWENCKEVSRLLNGAEWIMGPKYTVCDPYAFFFYQLGTRIRLPMEGLASYSGFHARMLDRPAVRKALELEAQLLKGANAWDGAYYAHPRPD
jgi:glutathione S-transferase